MGSRSKKLLVSAVVFALAVVGLEFGLRAAGFRHESGVQFGWPSPDQLARFVPDAELFWRMPPQPGFSNSLGFPAPGGREVEIPKPPGTYRLLFLGDSCTWGGFPFDVERELERRPPLAETLFESVALAVSGYSSHQGLLLARRHAARMQGDAAFVYFGWNDHWRARGTVDRDKRVAAAPEGESALETSRRDLRVFQLARWIRRGLRPADEPLDVPRVPPEHYRENLTAMYELFAALDVPLVFVTAPTSYYRLGVRPEPIENGLIGSAEEAVERHREYNEIVRTVAAATGAHLLDLEAAMAELPDLASLFRKDGIHFTPAGRAWLGVAIAEFVEAELMAR